MSTLVNTLINCITLIYICLSQSNIIIFTTCIKLLAKGSNVQFLLHHKGLICTNYILRLIKVKKYGLWNHGVHRFFLQAP